MKIDKPIVTIGIPVYNGSTMLGEMLESLRAQTFTAFRVIILDNASTDDTSEIALGFTAIDSRFSYHRNARNIGASPNYNRVFELGHSTPYYKWAPHDDLYAPTYLERCVSVLEEDTDAVLAYPITDVVDEVGDGRVLDWASYRLGVLGTFVDSRGRSGWTMGPLHLAEGADPAQRLDEFLNKMIACFPVLGVIRSDALSRSSLHRSYYGSDRALLAELVLMGHFRQVAERLFTNRYHKAASRDLTRQEKSRWIDTKGAQRWPAIRQMWDIVNAPAVAGLQPVERARCVSIALRHFARRKAAAVVRRINASTSRHTDERGAGVA